MQEERKHQEKGNVNKNGDKYLRIGFYKDARINYWITSRYMKNDPVHHQAKLTVYAGRVQDTSGTHPGRAISTLCRQ
uniref:Uncharacterized protein n=1 Tax=Romanomermis culicivorax TaxID=13658 RepID=A0A915L537_ROMCU